MPKPGAMWMSPPVVGASPPQSFSEPPFAELAVARPPLNANDPGTVSVDDPGEMMMFPAVDWEAPETITTLPPVKPTVVAVVGPAANTMGAPAVESV